ncbi:MAG: hypothetical protein HY080_01225 [Gammaproteobacteria bacterium]|nr:hypothetical protein [Gammaproteobacteria bacterium]
MTYQNSTNQLIQALEIFVSGQDRSYEHANRIVGIIVENFYEDERFGDLMELLATYRPEGGEYLFNEEQALKKCESVLLKLKTKKKGSDAD